MNMTKKKTTLLALALIAVFFAGMVAAQVLLPPRYVYVTVEEAISILPKSVTITMFVGETKTADFTISNAASVPIPLNILAEVTAVPEGGNAAHVTLAYPETLTVEPGDTTLTITITFATGAVSGDYAITIGAIRV